MSLLPPDLPLASIDAARPVFLMVMGVFLLIVAWRLTRGRSDWSSRILMAGALLLAFGYAVVLPLYQAGLVVPVAHLHHFLDADPAVAMGWHLAKIFAMNGGWLFFGLGLALRAGVFDRSVAPEEKPLASPLHEPVA